MWQVFHLSKLLSISSIRLYFYCLYLNINFPWVFCTEPEAAALALEIEKGNTIKMVMD